MNIPRRLEFMALLREMSDDKEQNRLWLNHEDFPNSSGIDEVFHFIFDDTDLGDDPSKEVGLILRNDKEVVSVKNLTNILEIILKEVGDANSRTFLSHPMWPDVMKRAREALKIFEGA